MTKEEFNDELKEADSSPKKSAFIQKHLVHGTPFVFGGDEGRYFEFRKRVADKFGIDYQQVFVVGSAKLGFSYVKNSEFSLESDVDLVIVNGDLFDQYHQSISDYQYQLDKYLQTITVGESKQYNRFLKYFVKGWMRPDLLPSSFEVEVLRNQWFEFFRSISNGRSEVGNYKVSAGLFKSMVFFEKYHLQSINKVQEKINIEDV